MATQVVYKIDGQNHLQSLDGLPAPSDIWLEAASPFFRISRYWAVKDRTAVDTDLSLDEVRDLILSVSPAHQFVTLHRVHTREDSRVLIPFPTLLLCFEAASEKMACTSEKDRLELFGYVLGRMGCAGGDGLVDDFPYGFLATYDRFGIQLAETHEQVQKAIMQLSVFS